ncbi:hypothetical protein FQR65_LT15613 [Abscondita terminalis]|nr:hypothetical protein FQR65_LT15613 [Abscondita terminalis]
MPLILMPPVRLPEQGYSVLELFQALEGTRVTILYPKGKVSEVQEQQLTTNGQNIRALEVDGTFDDCQGAGEEGIQ